MDKRIYQFDQGDGSMKDLLGGKGANLAEMVKLGLPVPLGFTITTETCMDYLDPAQNIVAELEAELKEHLELLEAKTQKKFDGDENLLLVSVRSGAKVSMPGMMDTILNLGLNDQTVEVLAEQTGNPRFAYDCYRRLLQMFGDVVYGIPGPEFEHKLKRIRQEFNYEADSELTPENLQRLIQEYKEIYTKYDREFPQDPILQMKEAIYAVFNSWNNQRAKVYRSLNDIPDHLGTAVNIQEMVFGNSGDESGTGVCFTRNPTNGDKELYGEYLINAQGEDVVAGIRTPEPISSMEQQLPEAYAEFVKVTELLEDHLHDMQDIEFTIENGKLYILQTRNGKRTAKAAFQIAVDMVDEGRLSKEEAILSLNAGSVDQLLHPSFAPEALEAAEVISSKGLPASPGAATGRIYFDAHTALQHANAGEKVILMRTETSPEDIEGMAVAQAIVTSTGGMTSHAAVVARGMGRCCVAGCVDLDINYDTKKVTYQGGVLQEGDIVSVDGTLGQIYLGELETQASNQDETFDKIMEWSREFSRLKIRMNAETISDIKTGFHFMADGIGLARTEHMFFAPERLIEIRRFILAHGEYERNEAMRNILPYQEDDFTQIFTITQERPVVIRLLDPPLHEFLPHTDDDVRLVSEQLNVELPQLKSRINELKETNPMLGHRGCRLAITYPELYTMQAEAIIRAAIKVKNTGADVKPEIMVPLVGSRKELSIIREQLIEHIDGLLEKLGEEVDYTIGTMIEIPRACLTADEIAEDSDFFSFGTNDLTQLAFGFSRDDANRFLFDYIDKDILVDDPFQTIDLDGVGSLVKMAVDKGRDTKPGLKMGVCGELGGDPKSIHFFNEVGLDYVSCSPYRIPIAQIAAAQSNLMQEK